MVVLYVKTLVIEVRNVKYRVKIGLGVVSGWALTIGLLFFDNPIYLNGPLRQMSDDEVA